MLLGVTESDQGKGLHEAMINLTHAGGNRRVANRHLRGQKQTTFERTRAFNFGGLRRLPWGTASLGNMSSHLM